MISNEPCFILWFFFPEQPPEKQNVSCSPVQALPHEKRGTDDSHSKVVVTRYRNNMEYQVFSTTS